MKRKIFVWAVLVEVMLGAIVALSATLTASNGNNGCIFIAIATLFAGIIEAKMVGHWEVFEAKDEADMFISVLYYLLVQLLLGVVIAITAVLGNEYGDLRFVCIAVLVMITFGGNAGFFSKEAFKKK